MDDLSLLQLYPTEAAVAKQNTELSNQINIFKFLFWSSVALNVILIYSISKNQYKYVQRNI